MSRRTRGNDGTSVVAPSDPIFYGWILVAVGFVLQGIATGTTQYLIGVFTLPLASEFNASRAAVLLHTQTMLSGAGALMGPVIGILMLRYSLRGMLLVAVAAMAGGFIVIAHATQLWHIAVGYAGFLPISVSTITLGTTSLVTNWFSNARGRALGLMTAGTSAFGFALPPLVAFWIGEYGWRTSCLILAGLALATLPLIVWTIVDKPEQRGLQPDGHASRSGETNLESLNPDADWTLGAVLKSLRFWVISLAISLCIGVAVIIITSIIPFAIDAGNSPAKAAYLASVIALFAFLGKIAFGTLADHVGQRLLIWLPAALLGLACFLISLQPGYTVLCIASMMVGSSLGALTPGWGMLVSLGFGRRAFSMAMGATLPVLALVIAVGVPMAGLIHDMTGGYQDLWWLLIILLAAAAGAGSFLPRDR